MLFAGGVATLLDRSRGATEDDGRAGRGATSRAAGLGAGDVVICVVRQRHDPLHRRRRRRPPAPRGATVVGIANVAGSPLLAARRLAVLLDTGPEVVAGSTRMGAATAQKIALNMISTLAGIRLGHVHDGYMVNVVADNAKLRDRAARIVAAIAGADEPAARAALDADRRRGQARRS